MTASAWEVWRAGLPSGSVDGRYSGGAKRVLLFSNQQLDGRFLAVPRTRYSRLLPGMVPSPRGDAPGCDEDATFDCLQVFRLALYGVPGPAIGVLVSVFGPLDERIRQVRSQEVGSELRSCLRSSGNPARAPGFPRGCVVTLKGNHHYLVLSNPAHLAHRRLRVFTAVKLEASLVGDPPLEMVMITPVSPLEGIRSYYVLTETLCTLDEIIDCPVRDDAINFDDTEVDKAVRAVASEVLAPCR